jgi:hypothetical protein
LKSQQKQPARDSIKSNESKERKASVKASNIDNKSLRLSSSSNSTASTLGVGEENFKNRSSNEAKSSKSFSSKDSISSSTDSSSCLGKANLRKAKRSDSSSSSSSSTQSNNLFKRQTSDEKTVTDTNGTNTQTLSQEHNNHNNNNNNSLSKNLAKNINKDKAEDKKDKDDPVEIEHTLLSIKEEMLDFEQPIVTSVQQNESAQVTTELKQSIKSAKIKSRHSSTSSGEISNIKDTSDSTIQRKFKHMISLTNESSGSRSSSDQLESSFNRLNPEKKNTELNLKQSETNNPNKEDTAKVKEHIDSSGGLIFPSDTINNSSQNQLIEEPLMNRSSRSFVQDPTTLTKKTVEKEDAILLTNLTSVSKLDTSHLNDSTNKSSLSLTGTNEDNLIPVNSLNNSAYLNVKNSSECKYSFHMIGKEKKSLYFIKIHL